jgi:group I intron endonuclease
MIVYRATFPNGGTYIGATKFNLQDRRSRHYYSSRRGSDFIFHQAIRKYGEESIVWEILREVETIEQASILEREEIKKARLSGKSYNQCDGGDGLIGQKHTEERKKFLSEKLKGRRFSVEHRQKISKALMGIKRGPMSDEQKEKIRQSMTGQRRTDPVYLEKLSKGLNEYYVKNPKMIFDVFTIDGRFVQRYYKIKDFIRERGGCNTGVYNCCIGKKKTHRGYIFKKVTNAPTTTSEATVG